MLSKDTHTRRLQALLILLFSVSLTALLHKIGLEYSLYWSLWWFDVLLHILGGFSLGLLCAFFVSKRSIFLTLICLILLILAWEVFEVVFVIQTETNTITYITDTFQDVFLGFVSGLIALRFYYRQERKLG